jgi:hypothetical protein
MVWPWQEFGNQILFRHVGRVFVLIFPSRESELLSWSSGGNDFPWVVRLGRSLAWVFHISL